MLSCISAVVAHQKSPTFTLLFCRSSFWSIPVSIKSPTMQAVLIDHYFKLLSQLLGVILINCVKFIALFFCHFLSFYILHNLQDFHFEFHLIALVLTSSALTSILRVLLMYFLVLEMSLCPV